MSLDAGSVYATLGGRFDPVAFHAFGRAMGTARTQMETGEKAMKTSSQRTSASLHAMGHAAKTGAGVAIFALGGTILAATKKAADFEAQLSKLGAVTDANARQMGALRKQAMEAGAATKFSALEAAEAQTALAKGGLSVAQIMKGGLSAALALAAAGDLELAAAAETTVNAMKQFGIEGGKAGHVADALATAANQTTVGVSDLAMALTQGGGVAAMAGASFDETVAAIEALADASIRGSDAGTSLKSFFLNIATPSAQAKEAMEGLGMSIFTTSGDLKSMPAIADNLRDSFGDLTKQQFLNRAGIIAGSDAARALFAIYKAGPDGMRGYLKGLKEQGTAAEMAAKQQDNLKGRVENLKGSLETAAIAGGSKLLPMFEDLAVAGTDWINELVESGDIDAFADDVVDALRTVGTVIGDVAEAAAPVAGVFLDIADAIADLDATEIEAMLAAIAGFKVANTVAPMVATLASGIGNLVLNARTAPSAMAFMKSLPISPWTALAAGVAAVAAGLVILGSRESDESRNARESAEAHKAQAEAIRDVARAEREAADSGLAAKGADLRVDQAKADTARARADLATARGMSSDDPGRTEAIADAHRGVKEAVLAEKQAVLDAGAAHAKYATDVKAQADTNARRVTRAADDLAKARDRLAETLNDDGTIADFDEHYRQQQRVTEATRAYVQAVAKAAVSDTSRRRLMNESTQITERNAIGISKLIGVLDRVPKRVRTQMLLDDQRALARAGNYLAEVEKIAGKRVTTQITAKTESAKSLVLAFKAVVAGVPPRAVLNIVANAKTKKDEVDQLRDAIGKVKPGPPVNIQSNAAQRRAEIQNLQSQVDALTGKTIVITTKYETVGSPPRRAAGRGPIGGEDALVGEGGAPEWWIDGKTGARALINGPTMMRLAPQDYVIPTEQRYRGRALGLLADVAASIGAQGYKKGRGAKVKIGGQKVTGQQTKKGAWKDLSIPPAIAQGGVPFDRVQSDRDSIHDRYLAAKKRAADLERDRSKTFRELEEARKKTRRLESGPYKGEFANHETRSRLSKEWERLKRQSEAAKAKLPGLERRDKLATEALKAARKTDEKAKNLQTAINLARDAMDTANQRQDAGGYTTAKADRQARISDLINLLRTQLSQVPAGAFPDYVRTIKEQLSQLGGPAALKGVKRGQKPGAVDPADLGGDFGDTGAEEMRTEEPPAAGTFTDAEQERLDKIEADIALAGLTDTLEDDKAHAVTLESFLSEVLSSAQANPAARGGQSAIADLAGRLKVARGQLADLTRAPDKTADQQADQQAQIDQLTRSLAVANQAAASNAAWATVAGGPGDIGSGGPSARQAAAPQIVIQTLHPGDPATLRAIGEAATAGLGYRGFRESPRRKVGP